MNGLFVVAVLLLVFCGSCVECLKCQSDDGVTEEDVRRIVRVCMRKIGGGFYDGSDYDDDDDDDGDGSNTDEYSLNLDERSSKRHDEYDYRPRNRKRYENFQKALRGGYYSDYETPSRNDGRGDGNRQKSHNTSITDIQAERDRACMIHCFFQEMKMTNDHQLPDKHKVLQVLTKDLRDKQLKEFYINSIQECFYVLEVDHQRPSKCEFSTLLLQCLAERARTNCDDWDNRTIIF